MKLAILLLAGLIGMYSTGSFAQTVEGVQSFSQPEGSWKRENQNQTEEVKPQQRFYDEAGKFAIDNIVNAEQVFCYEVFPYNADYNGYTLDGFPIRGFCGVMGEPVRDMVTKYFLGTEGNVLFDQPEQCVIEPKIIIRFIRGVDYTDMLISSPCHSFTIFYGGNVHIYNFKPGAAIIDAMLKALAPKHAEFVSPSLLNQVIPIGIVQNEQQRKLVNKRSEPIRKWAEKVEKEEAERAAEEKKNNSGWNKLKMRSFGKQQ